MILSEGFESCKTSGSLQTGFELHHDVGRRSPIYYIYLFISALSCLSSITKAVGYLSSTLGITQWLVRSRPVLNFIMMSEGEEVRFIIYIDLFWSSPAFRVSIRLCYTSPGLWESHDDWFAPDRF